MNLRSNCIFHSKLFQIIIERFKTYYQNKHQNSPHHKGVGGAEWHTQPRDAAEMVHIHRLTWVSAPYSFGM